MSGLLLRLAGPLQAWGERSAFTATRDTAPFPTRSGLLGMFCAARGIGRDNSASELGAYRDLTFTIRIDRPGTLMTDFHTAGGGQPKHLTAATSGGDHKGAAVITRRHYLADAVFVVAVTGPTASITQIATALQQPHWAPHLGRRSCVPDEPLLLRALVADPVDELKTRVPLANSATGTGSEPHGLDEYVEVDFLQETTHEQPSPDDAVSYELFDTPVSFAPHHRSHTKRHLHRTTEKLPTTLLGEPATLHHRLIDYAKDHA